MTDFCVEALHSLNVRPRDIRREMFGTRQDIQNEPSLPQELSNRGFQTQSRRQDYRRKMQ